MDFSQRSEYVDKMEQAKNNYYEQHKKNRIFKNKQKLECSQSIVNNLDLQKMIQCTIFRIPNTNKIFYNYLVFKTYGSEMISDVFYNYTKSLVEGILKEYHTFEFHVNLKTFSVSAAQRYYGMITSTFDESTVFTDKMSKIYIYNTPSLLDQIRVLLYNSIKGVISKTEYYYKDSDDRISELLKSCMN